MASLMFFQRCRRALYAVGPVCFVLCAAAASAADSGWHLLQQNQNSAARAAFQAALRKTPTDADALRGLGQVEQSEDNERAALAALRRLYHVAPAHWSALAYWPKVTELTLDTGRWDLLEGAARDVLAARGSSPALQASAHLALARAADRAGRPAEAAKEWAALGYLRRWQVIGPFDNASLSGFDKTYPPEREIAFANAYTGKDDQILHWHPLAVVGRDGQCGVGASLGDGEADVFYAVTAVQSPREQSVQLQFDPTGASKVFVNGQAVSVDPLKRSHAALLADPFAIPAILHPGWNTILIKVSDDTNLTAAFALRVTGQDGRGLPALAVNPLSAKGYGPDRLAAPAPPEMASVGLLRRQPMDAEVSALLGTSLRLARDYQASADALRAGIALAPDCGWLHWELAQTLREDDQEDEGRGERDRALAHNPRLVEAVLAGVADAEKAVSPADLITRTRAALTLNPSSPDALWLLARAYDNAKLNSQALKTARQATALAPGTQALLHLISMEEDQNKNADAAATLAAALRGGPGDTALLNTRAVTLADRNSIAAAVGIYRRLVSLDPGNTTYPVELAKQYEGMKRFGEAAGELKLARAERPQDADPAATLADLLQEMGKTAEAVSLYSEAIRLDPAQLTLRDKRAVLSGDQPVIDLVPAADGGPILAAAAGVKDAGASAVLLLDEARTVVYPDYATLTRYHQIIKVLDQAGVQRYQSYPLARQTSTASATVESARLRKADGEAQDVTDDAGDTGVSFPSLSPGDVIDVTYRVEDFHRGGLARQFWGEWFFSSTDVPNRLSRYVLIAPPGMVFQTRSHGQIPSPVVKDVSGWRIREWRMSDVAARRSEVLGTGATDSATWLDLSTLSSWTQIVHWYQDLSRVRCLPDAAIRAKAQQLTKDAKTEEDKIHALQAFVAREIQYQSSPFRLSAYVPTEGKQVLRERYGDCKDKAALLTALLGAVGIHADMVLLSGRTSGLTPYLPSPRFNHAIARVSTSQGPLWIDATADQLGFGALPPADQQVPALVVSDSTTDLSETPTLPAGRERSTETFTGTLGQDGTLHGAFHWDLTGSLAWMVRSVCREVPSDRQGEMLRGIVSALIKNAVFESGGFEKLSDPDPPLALQVQYHVEHFSTPAGNFLLLPMPWNTEDEDKTVTALLAEPSRTQDLELAASRTDSHSLVRLTLPLGYTAPELPPDVHQDTPFGAFAITYQVKGGVLLVTRDLNLTALRLSAKDVSRYAAFLQTASQASERPLVLKKL